MVGLGTIIEGKNAVLSVIESGRATSIGYLDNERSSADIQNILSLAVQNKIELKAYSSKEEWPYHSRPVSYTHLTVPTKA